MRRRQLRLTYRTFRSVRRFAVLGHLLTVDLTGRMPGSNWLLMFEFDQLNIVGCGRQPVMVFGAADQQTA
ncbi:MAG TPA: hypothetical protein VNS61_13155, partial [Caldimonas sp.]|nr:hypothetical protein [Caldimonas sp.]